jgi:hypothetical protein
MKNLFLFLMFSFSSIGWSQRGGSDSVGGGGAELGVLFMTEAERVLNRMAAVDQDVIDVNDLREALNRSVNVLPVDVITHPATNEVLIGLDAYSTDKEILLKKDLWNAYLNSERKKILLRYDVLIAHEIFRVAEAQHILAERQILLNEKVNSSKKNKKKQNTERKLKDFDDDGYRLSIGLFKLGEITRRDDTYLDDVVVSEMQNNWKSEMENLSQKAESSLSEIRLLLEQKNFGQALSLSRKYIQQISEKMGVNFRISGQRIRIDVANILLLTDLTTPFNDLSKDRKEIITQVVYEHLSGNFLDLLNLLKRVNVLQLEALYFQSLEQKKVNGGSLTKTEVDFHIKSAVKAMNIEIEIFDKSNSFSYLVFDNEVASDTFQYVFNIELFTWVLNSDGLNLNEANLNELQSEYKNNSRNDFLNSTKSLRIYTFEECIDKLFVASSAFNQDGKHEDGRNTKDDIQRMKTDVFAEICHKKENRLKILINKVIILTHKTGYTKSPFNNYGAYSNLRVVILDFYSDARNELGL